MEPLKLRIDDAELSDLVRVLDRLELDRRVQLAWQLPADQPLARHELVERIPLQRRFGPSSRQSCPGRQCPGCHGDPLADHRDSSAGG